MTLLQRARARIMLPKGTRGQDLLLAFRHVIDLGSLYRLHANNEVAYYNLLFSVAMAAAPTVIVELGTGPGLSSLAFLRVLQYYNAVCHRSGRLHTCDLEADTLAPLKRFGGLVEPHRMPTDQLAAEWAQHATPIDFLYIDADHSAAQSLKDFENFTPYLRPNGLVLMHDTFPLSEEHEQLQFSGTVFRTARYIKEHRQADFEIATIPYLSGVSIVRKSGAKYF